MPTKPWLVTHSAIRYMGKPCTLVFLRKKASEVEEESEEETENEQQSMELEEPVVIADQPWHEAEPVAGPSDMVDDGNDTIESIIQNFPKHIYIICAIHT